MRGDCMRMHGSIGEVSPWTDSIGEYDNSIDKAVLVVVVRKQAWFAFEKEWRENFFVLARELKIFGTKTKKFSRVFSRKHEPQSGRLTCTEKSWPPRVSTFFSTRQPNRSPLYTTNRATDQERNSDSERRSNASSQIHLSVAFICGICTANKKREKRNRIRIIAIFASAIGM